VGGLGEGGVIGIGDLISAFIGVPTIFAVYAVVLAVTMVAAIFSRSAMLRFAIAVIVASWLLTRFWRMSGLFPGAGFLTIDLILVYVFVLAWKRRRRPDRQIVKHMAILHALFVALHFVSELVDLSATVFGREFSHSWMYGFWRNRIFDLCLLYILTLSGIRIVLSRSDRARRCVTKLYGAWRSGRHHRLHGDEKNLDVPRHNVEKTTSGIFAFLVNSFTFFFTVARADKGSGMTGDKRDKPTPAPTELIAAILHDTHPDMDDIHRDLQLLEAAKIGAMAAEQRAHNQSRAAPDWLLAIKAIIDQRFAAIGRQIQGIRDRDAA